MKNVVDYVTACHGYRAMFQLSIYAGMRVGEIAALKWADVFASDHRVREQIQLTAAQTKGEKARTVL